MVSGPIPPQSTLPGGTPIIPGGAPATPPPAPVQPAPPPVDPSSQQGQSSPPQSESVALNRSNGRDRVQISQNALNAAANGELASPNAPSISRPSSNLNGAPNAPQSGQIRENAQEVNSRPPNQIDPTPQAFNQPRQTFAPPSGAPEVGLTVDLFG